MVIANEVTNAVNPLDLWDLFINQIAGSWVIFIAISFVMLAILGAKLRVPNQVMLILFIIYGLVIGNYFNGVLVLTIVAVSFFFSWALSKVIGRT